MNIYICPGCDWTRQFPHEEVAEYKYTHPIHGEVTLKEGALADVAKHKCDEYNRAIKRWRERMAVNADLQEVSKV